MPAPRRTLSVLRDEQCCSDNSDSGSELACESPKLPGPELLRNHEGEYFRVVHG